MWYVFRCNSGEEEKVRQLCKQKIAPGILKDAFVFTYDRMKRYKGCWHMEKEKLFPGYVFLESDQESELAGKLKQYCGYMRMDGSSYKNMLWKVNPEEERFLRLLCGKSHHLVMSRGCIRDGNTYVEDGPLRGMEQHIRKIDRHKRIAKIYVPDSRFTTGSMMAGLEIMEKN